MINYRIFNKYNFSKRKFWFVIILLLFALISTFQIDYFAVANTSLDIESTLSDSVFGILESLDLSSIQNLVDSVDSFSIFDVSVKDKLELILKGEYFTNYESLIGAIFSLVFVDIKNVLPFVLTLIAIGILSNMIINLKSDNRNINNIVSFVFFMVMIIIILIAFKSILSLTSGLFTTLTSQMQIIFPILITLLSSIGSFSSISIYDPLVAILTNVVSFIFDKLLYPIFITIFLFTILNYLTNSVKLDKLIGFLNSSFKWIIGIVFTLFSGFLAIQGISAGKYDSVSIKATKFAMKSYIPIIGSYISDGMDFFILGSVLVKNAVGLVGVIILFVTIISPIITILVYKLSLQFCGGILELTGNDKMSGFLNSCSKILILPIVLILGIAFMYVITICLIICTANIF